MEIDWIDDWLLGEEKFDGNIQSPFSLFFLFLSLFTGGKEWQNVSDQSLSVFFCGATLQTASMICAHNTIFRRAPRDQRIKIAKMPPMLPRSDMVLFPACILLLGSFILRYLRE